VKALTIYQPWASLIMAGAKPYEFRSWPAPQFVVGQRIVIHAGAPKMDPRELKVLLWKLGRPNSHLTGLLADKAVPILERAQQQPAIFPRKHALGTAVLGKPVRACDLWPEAFASDSTRIEQSNWAWPLTEIQHFDEPVPMNGAQGFWNFGNALQKEDDR